jgi:flagellar biosynthesis/type III secretory pathway protein FliH
VIHQLPETPDTLWLRILGKQKVQQRAIDDINQLDPNSPYRQNALKLLADLMVVLAARQNQNNQETELIMSLRTSAIYLEQIEKITQQAIKQGLEQGLEQGRSAGERQLVLKLLTRKLGGLSPELITKVSELSLDRLETLGEDLLDFEGIGELENWLG